MARCRHIEEVGERSAIVWEPKQLRNMGHMFRDILFREIPTNLLQQILGLTVLTSILGAIQV